MEIKKLAVFGVLALAAIVMAIPAVSACFGGCGFGGLGWGGWGGNGWWDWAGRPGVGGCGLGWGGCGLGGLGWGGWWADPQCIAGSGPPCKNSMHHI